MREEYEAAPPEDFGQIVGQEPSQHAKRLPFPACDGHFPKGFIGYSKGFPMLRRSCLRQP